ncbi:kinesin-1 [Cavenderia fasciculata]|uniref:Kinesin-1 n=1 Tax=Cavenderia fasciculata TaxID=261658 RepID=F4PGI3_CACFS|nr:kinesin-1 [Cavenderia fasciculata]EGG24817.1 kinesin-1 [Cavenderia fasciculata]|eukprot:XP_004362668.1 kinesin-1 [Cavenderia fasciculata]
MATSCNIKVMARFRPLNSKEKADTSSPCIAQFPEETQLVVNGTGPHRDQSIPFTFDRVFPPETTQEDIFQQLQSTIDDILNGYNGTILCYGQTSSGKTFTMFGPDDREDVENQGIVPRASVHIFNRIAEDPSGSEFTIKCSFVEIYMEIIKDLLNPKNKNLKIRESKTNGIWIEAGSEKISKTGAEGQTLEEAKKINQSLSLLGNCIMALTDSKRDHIPFRDSKLTRILQESLGGNTKTTLMVTCSPHISNLEESISTLKFGARAKMIKNTVKINSQKSAAELTKELETLKMYTNSLEKLIEYMKSPDYVPGKSALPDLAILTAAQQQQQQVPSASTTAAAKTKTARHSTALSGSAAPGAPTGNHAAAGGSSPNRHSVAYSQSPMSAISPPIDFNPMAMADMSGQIDRIREECQEMIDKCNDEISEIKIKYETTTEELIGVRSELEGARDTIKQNDADQKGAKETERKLLTEVEGRELKIHTLGQQLEDYKMLATQVVQYLERKKVTDEYFEGADANDSSSLSTMSRSISSTSFDEDYDLNGPENINIEEVIGNLSEEEVLSMQIKLQLQTKVNILEQRELQLSEELRSIESLLTESNIKYSEIEREKKELAIRLQSLMETQRDRQQQLISTSQINLGKLLSGEDQTTTTSFSPITSSPLSPISPLKHNSTENILDLSLDYQNGHNNSSLLDQSISSDVSIHLQLQLEQSELDKRNLDLSVVQLQQESSELKEKELKLLHELKLSKNANDKLLQDFQLYKEDIGMKTKIQQNQMTNLHNELTSLKNKLKQEKKMKDQIQNQNISVSKKLNDSIKIHEETEERMKKELLSKDNENSLLKEQYNNMVDQCEDLQEQLTTAHRLLVSRKVVKIVRSDEKAQKRAYEVKEDFGQHTLKKTGRQLF